MRFDKGFLFLFVLESERSPKKINDPDVVEDFFRIFKRLKIVCPVLLLELVENLSNGFGSLPFVQVDTGILQGSLFALLPYLGHRAANDVHQLIPEDEARNGGDQEGEDDSRDRYPEILEVLEERLLGRGITLIPELKDFFQEEHPRWADWFSAGIPGGRGSCCPYFRARGGGMRWVSGARRAFRGPSENIFGGEGAKSVEFAQILPRRADLPCLKARKDGIR